MRDFGAFFASSSAPDELFAMTRFVLSASIGREQVTITLFEGSPACFKTSSTRDQCTASNSASASFAASCGVPARAFPFAARQPLELIFTPCVTEYDLVPSPREDRSQ